MLPRVSLAVGIAAGLTFALTTGLPSAALHAEEMAWTVHRYESDVPDDADTVVLTYGIPETDAVAFEAVCGGRDGPEPRVVFWYDIVDLSEHEDVVVSFSSGSFKDELPGKVYGKDAEVGVSGIQMTIDAGAPLWSAMTAGTTLNYGIEGGKRETLHLKDAAIAVGGFAAACKAGAAPSSGGEAALRDVPAGDPMAQAAGSAIAASLNELASKSPNGAPASPKAHAVSCKAFGTLRSKDSEISATVTFVNASDGYRGLVWIDPEGTPIDNTGLNQGESVTVPTFEWHVWMITDGPGNCIEMLVSPAGETTFEISAPAPILGPEDD